VGQAWHNRGGNSRVSCQPVDFEVSCYIHCNPYVLQNDSELTRQHNSEVNVPREEVIPSGCLNGTAGDRCYVVAFVKHCAHVAGVPVA